MEGSETTPEESEALLNMSLPDQGCCSCPFTVRTEHGWNAPSDFPPSHHDIAAALLLHDDQLPLILFLPVLLLA